MPDCTELTILDATFELLVADTLTESPVFSSYGRSRPATLVGTRLPAVYVELAPDGIEEFMVGMSGGKSDSILNLDFIIVAYDGETEDARDASLNLAKLVKRVLGRVSNRKQGSQAWRYATFRTPAIAPGYIEEAGRRVRTAVVRWKCEFAESLET
jgi:hypothetical protein